MNAKFSAGVDSGYAELPFDVAWLKWSRGDAKLVQLAEKDPGAYFGGWRAMVKSKDGEALPALPLPIVERVSEDGKARYSVYATNSLTFLPIAARVRFELRQKVKDEETGREYERAVHVSKSKREGYAPNRQVFGVVYSADLKQTAYAVLVINKWSSFISFEKAERAWLKKGRPGQLVIRRYGTVGTKDKKGNVTPNFEVFGQSRSTPIEAIGLDEPLYVPITPELDELYDSVKAWQDCPVWNAEGAPNEAAETPVMTAFLEKARELRFTDDDIAKHLAYFDGDYKKALEGLSPDAINSRMADSEVEEA